jgi:hypothetical protein
MGFVAFALFVGQDWGVLPRPITSKRRIKAMKII